MIGKWIGQYWFTNNMPKSLKGIKTDFELIVDNYLPPKVSGKISDSIDMGGTPGLGFFKGTIKNNKIKFIKKMPIRTSVLNDGTRIEENKPHRPIYYKGEIDWDTKLIKGTWRFRNGIGFVRGTLVFYKGAKGEWEMKKIK